MCNMIDSLLFTCYPNSAEKLCHCVMVEGGSPLHVGKQMWLDLGRTPSKKVSWKDPIDPRGMQRLRFDLLMECFRLSDWRPACLTTGWAARAASFARQLPGTGSVNISWNITINTCWVLQSSPFHSITMSLPDIRQWCRLHKLPSSCAIVNLIK